MTLNRSFQYDDFVSDRPDPLESFMHPLRPTSPAHRGYMISPSKLIDKMKDAQFYAKATDTILPWKQTYPIHNDQAIVYAAPPRPSTQQSFFSSEGSNVSRATKSPSPGIGGPASPSGKFKKPRKGQIVPVVDSSDPSAAFGFPEIYKIHNLPKTSAGGESYHDLLPSQKAVYSDFVSLLSEIHPLLHKKLAQGAIVDARRKQNMLASFDGPPPQLGIPTRDVSVCTDSLSTAYSACQTDTLPTSDSAIGTEEVVVSNSGAQTENPTSSNMQCGTDFVEFATTCVQTEDDGPPPKSASELMLEMLVEQHKNLEKNMEIQQQALMEKLSTLMPGSEIAEYFCSMIKNNTTMIQEQTCLMEKVSALKTSTEMDISLASTAHAVVTHVTQQSEEMKRQISEQYDSLSTAMKNISLASRYANVYHPPPETLRQFEDLFASSSSISISASPQSTPNQHVFVPVPAALSGDGNSQITILPTATDDSGITFSAARKDNVCAIITNISDHLDIASYKTHKVQILSEDGTQPLGEVEIDVIPREEYRMPQSMEIKDSVGKIPRCQVVVENVSSQQVLFEGATDATGRISLVQEAPDGLYKIKIQPLETSNWNTQEITCVSVRNLRDGRQNLPKFVTRNLGDRDDIVLSWAERPRDLDSHMFTNTQQHVYYPQKRSSDGTITLDHDVTTGKGPETISVTVSPSIKYLYCVHNYSKESTLTSSQAFVRHVSGSTLRPEKQYRIPLQHRPSALYWVVFIIVNGKVFEINELVDTIKPHEYFSRDFH